MQAIDLKIALEKYHQIRKAYKTAEDGLDDINAKRFKAGSSIIRVPENPESREKTIIRNLEKLDQLKKDLEMYRYYMDLADIFIHMLPDKYREIVEDKYVKRLNCYQMQNKHYYSRWQINNIVDKAIEEFLNIS